MCQNSHLAHKLTPYHPKNTFLSISSLARNVPDMWPPASIDPEYLKSVIMESPDPPPHSLPHRCLHYWTGPGNLTVLANPSFCYLWFHFWCFCIIPDTPIAPCLLLLLWTTEGSVWNTSVGHRTLHMNQKMKQTLIQDKQELIVPLTIYI